MLKEQDVDAQGRHNIIFLSVVLIESLNLGMNDMKKSFASLIAILIFLLTSDLVDSQSVLSKFEIIGRDKSINIPFEYKNHFILTRVMYNKAIPLNFIFDTGAEHTLLLKKEYSDLLGNTYDRRIRLLGADQSVEMYALITRNVPMGLSPTVSFKQDLLVLEEDFFQLDELTGLYVDGIMSGSFFKTYVTHIDFKRNVLSFIQPNKFRINRKFVKVPIDIQNGKIYVKAEVTINNKKIPVKLLVDTGAGLPLLLYSDSNPDFKAPEKSIPGKLGKGLGGFLEGHIGKITELKLESFQFPDIVTSFQEMDSTIRLTASTQDIGFANRNGLIGNQLLSRFDIYIDYQKNLMYLNPIRDLKKEFRVDKSGMEILATGHDFKQFVVSSVIPSSPAQSAGLQKGDIIKRVGGLSTNLLGLDQIISTFSRKEGRKVKVQFIRNGVLKKTVVVLENLI